MHSTLQNAASTVGTALGSLWKDRRLVVGGSVGGSVLLVVIWIAAGHASPAPATSKAATGVAPLGGQPHGGLSRIPAETYPIPKETIAKLVPTDPVAGTPAGSGISAMRSGQTAARASGDNRGSRGRDMGRKAVASARGDLRAGRVRAPLTKQPRPPFTTTGSPPPALSPPASPAGGDAETVRRSVEPADAVAAPPTDLKKRVRLVDDSARVRLLE